MILPNSLSYSSAILSGVADVVHGFGHAGVPLEDYVGDARAFRTHQVHGKTVHVLDDERGEDLLNGDAFIASRAGVACFVRTADCVPILVADPVKRVVGAIHAGWRSTAKHIVAAALDAMRARFGTNPRDVRAAIGPAICAGCYEVGDEVIDALGGDHAVDGHIDLAAVNRDHLVKAGVAADGIDVLNICTACGDAPLSSYRRDANDVRQVSFILFRRR